MSNTSNPVAALELPRPVIKKNAPYHWMVWMLPVLALVAVGFYTRTYLTNRGPVITVSLVSAEGLRPGNTSLMYRGVAVGQVVAVNLSEDNKRALIDIRLRAEQADFAKKGSAFWVVRPEVSAMGLQGLNTLLSGPYLEAKPGTGEDQNEFVGLSGPPSAFGEGLDILVHATHIDHLQENSPLYFRGVQVGVVREVRLGREADRLEAKVTVWSRYAPLVRVNSKFWPLSGLDVKGGVFSGIEMNLGSIKTIMSGGLQFATPDKNIGVRAQEGTDFELAESSDKDWLKWAPRIPIHPGRSNLAEDPKPPRAGGPIDTMPMKSGKP